MSKSEGVQTFMITLIVTAGIYLLCLSVRDYFFPNTSQLLKLIEKDMSKIKKLHPELENMHIEKLVGARGDYLAQGWALFAKEAFSSTASKNYIAEILLISQEQQEAILQISITDSDNNFVKEVARTYSFAQ